MVYAAGGHNPTYKHDTEAQAKTEAARLARALRVPTYILKAITKIELFDIKETPLSDDIDLTFRGENPSNFQ